MEPSLTNLHEQRDGDFTSSKDRPVETQSMFKILNQVYKLELSIVVLLYPMGLSL